MSLELIDLNDAVYRMINRKYDYLYGINKDWFNKTNFPLLYQYDSKQIVSWCDFIKILGGTPGLSFGSGNSGTGDGGKWPGAGLRQRYYKDYSWSTDPNGWGKTFGKPKGKNGKPLCETKPLDSFYFHYDDVKYPRPFRNINTSNLMSEAVVIHADSTQDNYFRSADVDKYSYISSYALVGGTLQPGAYMAMVSDHKHYAGGWNETGIAIDGKDYIHSLGEYDNAWRLTNGIFFVDSPVQYTGRKNASAYWGFSYWSIFRITPEGSWE